MILVDVYVPLMEKTYDFRVDDTARISDLIDELCEMICQKERWPKLDSTRRMILCDFDSSQIFPGEATLAGMGITGGHRLMLL